MKNKKRSHLTKVETPVLNRLYHTSWSFHNGYVWQCVQINEQDKTVTLQTPKTKRLLARPVKWDDLLNTRKHSIIKNETRPINTKYTSANRNDL